MTNALGNLYDIAPQWIPHADLAAGAQTGKRIHFNKHESVTFVVFLAAVSAGTDTFVPDVQQHTASTSGTTADLDVVTTWYIKHEATLDNDEVWSRQTQSAGSEVSLTGATYTGQAIVVIEVDAAQLSDGYEWISIDMADPGTGGTRAGSAIAILNKPYNSRRPDRLPDLLA
jgi:Tol biopolymer transport system component